MYVDIKIHLWVYVVSNAYICVYTYVHVYKQCLKYVWVLM